MFEAINTDINTAAVLIPSGAIVETGESVRGYGAISSWIPFRPHRAYGIFTHAIYRWPEGSVSGWIDDKNLQSVTRSEVL